jgi:hypothetical protein
VLFLLAGITYDSSYWYAFRDPDFAMFNTQLLIATVSANFDMSNSLLRCHRVASCRELRDCWPRKRVLRSPMTTSIPAHLRSFNHLG